MNPEMHILKKNGCLNTVYIEIDNILTANIGIKYSSNELFEKLPNALKNQLIMIAASYNKGACSSPSAYVGSVASDMSNNVTNVIHDYDYFCPVLKRKEDGFVKI